MVTWVEIAGGATIFGLIVAIAAWLNGGRTTQILKEVIIAENEKTRNELGTILREHGAILREHGVILREEGAILREQGAILREHGVILREIVSELKANKEILSTLATKQS